MAVGVVERRHLRVLPRPNILEHLTWPARPLDGLRSLDRGSPSVVMYMAPRHQDLNTRCIIIIPIMTIDTYHLRWALLLIPIPWWLGERIHPWNCCHDLIQKYLGVNYPVVFVRNHTRKRIWEVLERTRIRVLPKSMVRILIGDGATMTMVHFTVFPFSDGILRIP